MAEHFFAPIIRTLGKGKKGSRSLSFEQAEMAFTAILEGRATPEQIGAFLMLLRVKEESPEELAGFVKACRKFINAPSHLTVDIDWSSYAGKRKQNPWFVLSLLVLRDAGYRILVHGGTGSQEDRLYTEHVFKALNLPIASSLTDAQSLLDQHGLCYLPLANFCKELQQLMDMRDLFGLRSPVHSLSRLLNPGNAPHSFCGIFHPSYADSQQQAALLLQQENLAVFKGESGEAERKPEANCVVKSIINGKAFEQMWPRVSHEKQAPDTLDPMLLKALWQGMLEHDYGQQAVITTLAIAIQSLEPSLEQAQAITKAQQLFNQRRTDALL